MINIHQEKLLWVAVISVVLIPLMIPLENVLVDVYKSPVIWQESDNAGIELNTISACQGHQLLGVSSRFEWNHPGPIYFYLMAPIYVLSGKNASGLSLAAIIIALVSVIAALVVARNGTDRSSRTLAYCAGILLTVYLWAIPVDSVWNPDVLYMPFVLFLFLCGLLFIGRVWTLPAIILVGSFLIQTHLGTAPCVLALALLSLTVCLFPRLTNIPGFRVVPHGSVRTWGAISAAIFVLCWLPPIFEQMTHSPGNLTKLYWFFVRPQEHHNVWMALVTFGKEVSWLRFLLPQSVWSGEYTRAAEVSSVVIGLSQLFVLVLIYPINLRKRQYFNAALSLITCLGSLVAVLSIVTIKGPIYGYLVWWMAGFGLVCYAVILSEAIDRLVNAGFLKWRLVRPRLVVWMALALIACSVAVIFRGLYDFRQRMAGEFAPRCSTAEERRVKELSECLLSYLDAEKISRPLIRWDHNRWPTAIGVILQLAKSNKPFGQEGLFGDDYAVNGKEDAVTVIKGHVETVKSEYKLICSHAMPPNPKHDEFYGNTFIYRFDTTKK